MSGRKNNLLSYQVITGGNAAGNLTSLPTNIQFLDNVGYQFNFSGTPSGTLSVQVSIDYQEDNEGNVTNAGHWIAVTLDVGGSPSTTIPIAGGSPAQVYVDITELSAPWIRAVFTHSGGTGTLNAFCTGKML